VELEKMNEVKKMVRTILCVWCVTSLIGATTSLLATARAESTEPEPVKIPLDAQDVLLVDDIGLEDVDFSGQLIEYPPDTPIMTHYLKLGTGLIGSVAGDDEVPFDEIAYENVPPPVFAFPPGNNKPIADDVVTVAVGGCDVWGYEIMVGGANSQGVPGNGSGPGFNVEFALYDGCPRPANQPNPGQVIPGTAGSMMVPNNGLHKIVVELANPVNVASTIWVWVKFSTNQGAWVVGTPAQRGFTSNVYSFVNSIPCVARFGGTNIYAGFHVRVFCNLPFEREFLAYYNPNVNLGGFSMAPNIYAVDDVTMIVDDCVLSSYEVTTSASGGPGQTYTLDAEVWRLCSPATVIAGSQKTFVLPADGSINIARVDIPGGVALPANDTIYVAWKTSRTHVAFFGAPNPVVGSSDNAFGLHDGAGPWTPDTCGFWFGGEPYANWRVVVRCLGDAPLGACCDLASSPTAGGDVSPYCREVPQISCQGPLVRYDQGGKCPGTCSLTSALCATDAECGKACAEAPHAACSTNADCTALGQGSCLTQNCVEATESFEPVCGSSACCTPPNYPNGGETCVDLSRDECMAINDGVGHTAVWTRGAFCDAPPNLENYDCVRWDCRYAEGACDVAHPTLGCNNAQCCDKICTADPFCCVVSWDSSCVSKATNPNTGCQLPASNDACDFGSTVVSNGTQQNANTAGENPSSFDEGFCCHPSSPGANGVGGVWFKFVATHTSAKIDTCSTPGGTANDSLIQVYDALDQSSQTASCDSLLPMACNDDACGAEGGLSSLCVFNLTVGRTYYILVAAKSAASQGVYKLNVDGPCPGGAGVLPPENNDCTSPLDISANSATAFTLDNATMFCPNVACEPDMDRDVWYRLFPVQGGLVDLSITGNTTDTTLLAYVGAECPITTARQRLCNPGRLSVTAFSDYLIRVGSRNGTEPTGMLQVGPILPDCDNNLRPDAEDLQCGAGNNCGACSISGALCMTDGDCPMGQTCPNASKKPGAPDCNTNTRPDSCDIALGISMDVNMDDIPDECIAPCILENPESVPPNCSIDARQPTALNDANMRFGWNSVKLSFDCSTAGLTPASFSVTSTAPGAAPTIMSVTPTGNDVTLNLSGPIRPSGWTCFTHMASMDQVCLGYLPCDVNQDGTCAAPDILGEIDCINNVATFDCEYFNTDIDRSDPGETGVPQAPDILRIIDLQNGAASFAPGFRDVSIGACPSAP